MAHESFEDATVANILNKLYVCIKVDKEERPDLDIIYMNACQIMTGGGGWPLNLWLTPDQRPVYAGTYFPKTNVYGRTGFIDVITQLAKMWHENASEMIGKSTEIMAYITKQAVTSKESLDPYSVIEAVRDLTKDFDDVYGGFSKAPKFPSPHQLLLLMDVYKNKPDQKILNMMTKTLDSLYQGGIYDHIGGGFARYSVDEKWLVPHFEKMLYDNALLLRTFAKGYQITHNPLYEEVAQSIVHFIERELTHHEGGFYTALDADSEGVEGKYYVWTPEEIHQVLGDNTTDYMEAYDITVEGNFEGLNIPNRIKKAPSFEVLSLHKSDHKKLLDYRETRVRPSLDYKQLTSMNGLMIGSLSMMYRTFEDYRCLELAITTHNYIQSHMMDSNKKLRGSYTKGQISETVILDDYAFYIEGLIELYQCTFEMTYLEEAIRLQKIVDEEFLDQKDGGYYMTSSHHERLIQRPKECYDGAIPSGNSVMALNLIKLSRLTDDLSYQETLDQLLKAFGSKVKKGPSYFAYLLMSAYQRIEGTSDLVVALPSESDKQDVISALHRSEEQFFTVDVRVDRSEKRPKDGKVTYYICKDFVCSSPTFEL
jgi:uncharacterized protein YyaL (SSP411 family)